MHPVATGGVGLKPQHFEAALNHPRDGLWFEVHAENYMVAGGPRLAWLSAIRERHPVAIHGVGMSLGGREPPRPDHLARLRTLVRRIEPMLVSEHLAWSAADGACFPDLLPVPRTREALDRVAANIGRVQDALGRPIAIENPSHYLPLRTHAFDEPEFLVTLARRTGCSLLVDVNNLFVSRRNVGLDPEAWIDAVPAELVAEIHVAGHSTDPRLGDALLIDSHDGPVAPGVWALLDRLVRRIGARPTLVERDENLPAFDELLVERARASAVLQAREAFAAVTA